MSSEMFTIPAMTWY